MCTSLIPRYVLNWVAICGILRHVSLSDDSKPIYETISYVWGDQTERSTVYLHGFPREVPASAVAVLRRIRFPTESRVVWIDSICIKQEDPDERSPQVAFMREIFGSGTRNLIWLGEADGYTEKALSDICLLVEDMRTETNDFKDAKGLLYSKHGNYITSKTKLSIKIDNYSALVHFYSSPWFSRLWVCIQRLNISSILRSWVQTTPCAS